MIAAPSPTAAAPAAAAGGAMAAAAAAAAELRWPPLSLSPESISMGRLGRRNRYHDRYDDL